MTSLPIRELELVHQSDRGARTLQTKAGRFYGTRVIFLAVERSKGVLEAVLEYKIPCYRSGKKGSNGEFDEYEGAVLTAQCRRVSFSPHFKPHDQIATDSLMDI